MPNRVTAHADYLLTNVLQHVAKSKHEAVIALFKAFKNEFPDAGPQGRRVWNDEQKANASAMWQAKREEEKFYQRVSDGSVRELVGIETAARAMKLRVATLRCYLSLGKGSAQVRGLMISREPLLPMSAADAWAESFYAKNKYWPNPSDNPHDGAERRY